MNSTLSASTSTLAGKYLTVVLDNESYAISVSKVREIIRRQKITPMHQMPEYVKGVINLRGRVVPVIDLRVKFGLTALYTDRTCIVVVEVGPKLQMGVVVDSVDEVLNFSANDIAPPPSFGTSVNTAYLLGMAKSKGGVKTLLDIAHVLTGDILRDLAAVE